MDRTPHNIVVASYPRSGTHLAIDLIRNNIIGFDKPYISVPRRCGQTCPRGTASLVRRLSYGRRVFKTHLLPERFITPTPPQEALMTFVAKNSLFLYVLRDGRDAIVSEFQRDIQRQAIDGATTLTEYMWERRAGQGKTETRVDEWARHVDSWMKQATLPVIILPFADLLSTPETTLSQISQAAMCKRSKCFRDPRLSVVDRDWTPRRFPNHPVSRNALEHTSIGFNRGQTGDYARYMRPSDLSLFRERMRQYEWHAQVCE